MIVRLLLLAAIAAAGAAGAYAWLEARSTAVEGLPPIRQEDPAPGSPPVVWISGTVAEVGPDRLEVREGDGPTVRIQRFAEGATRFFVPAPGEWHRMGGAAVEGIRPGRSACVEALLDGERLLGLRVFLDTRCAPVP